MATSGNQRFPRGVAGVAGIVGVAAILLALLAGGVVLATDHSPTRLKVSPTSADGTAPKGRSSTTTTTAPPLDVASISPSDATAGVGFQAPVTVRFSTALSASSPDPTISPATSGNWQRVSATELEFQPTGQYVPYTKETLTLPATMRSAGGLTLGHVVTSTFTVEGASVLRLQELLAQLGYLPLRFVPKSSGAATTKPPAAATPVPPAPAITGTTVVAAPQPPRVHDHESSDAGTIDLAAVPGRFVWRFPDIPTTLSSLWSAGAANEITTGAVMAFESDHNLDDDGVAGPAVWRALLEAVASRQYDTAPYNYVYVSEGDPEFVTVWSDGVNVFTTLANTGIAQAPTQAGTWPVYARYFTTTMSGTNPDGSHYSDPGIPWVSYFHGGDALHGFLRSQYGFPQSLGCVEMPYSSAKTVFPYTPIGTLVTVE